MIPFVKSAMCVCQHSVLVVMSYHSVKQRNEIPSTLNVIEASGHQTTAASGPVVPVKKKRTNTKQKQTGKILGNKIQCADKFTNLAAHHMASRLRKSSKVGHLYSPPDGPSV